MIEFIINLGIVAAVLAAFGVGLTILGYVAVLIGGYLNELERRRGPKVSSTVALVGMFVTLSVAGAAIMTFVP